MSIYSRAETGTSHLKSRFSKSISGRMDYDCRFHELIPVLKRFCLPGDVWRIGGDVLVRFQPMLTPTLTPNTFRVRYFFVPLRLIEENAELIITGSKNGKLFEASEENPLPEFNDFIASASGSSKKIVSKYGFWDYMNVQCGDYSSFTNKEFFPAEYWYKGYLRIKFDYYRDENYDSEDDFDTWWNTKKTEAAAAPIEFSKLSKDYFTSALPWQLKGVAPVLEVTGDASFTPNFQASTFDGTKANNLFLAQSGNYTMSANDQNPSSSTTQGAFMVNGSPSSTVKGYMTKNVLKFLNQPQESGVTINNLGFNADELRTMMAQTRIFERLARCGSRYVEYLRANFGTAPADDTLQRAQYLGGWKVPIVTTEVLQTGEGTNPVGTMRGHGITRGGQRIGTFYCKEFGLLFGLAEIRPDVTYTTGINRQFTYKRRFDFFNPSFQHLSEQEVRNGELYVNFTADAQGHYDNDDTLGFQAYANELRSYQNETVADLRANLAQWTQALQFSSRPNVSGLLTAENHLQSFNAPFGFLADSSRPCIVQFYNALDVYRPMVRYATPGLVDHL